MKAAGTDATSRVSRFNADATSRETNSDPCATLKRVDRSFAWPTRGYFKPCADDAHPHFILSSSFPSPFSSSPNPSNSSGDAEVLVLRVGGRRRWQRQFIARRILAPPPSLFGTLGIHGSRLLWRRGGLEATAAAGAVVAPPRGGGSDGRRVRPSNGDQDGAFAPLDGPDATVAGAGQGGATIPAALPRQAGAGVPTPAGQGGTRLPPPDATVAASRLDAASRTSRRRPRTIAASRSDAASRMSRPRTRTTGTPALTGLPSRQGGTAACDHEGAGPHHPLPQRRWSLGIEGHLLQGGAHGVAVGTVRAAQR